ncbi:PAS domain S-box-containing protein [Azospirillum lipoferum]|uniref:response regulator n=1 Tax=Azospirillum TaxID=191 RepID=UPI001FEC2FBB|nr:MULTISPECIES: response regulator [Azospirillum]MCP1609006.1 PAS domain S-box-containing protein [Azospirillum lipoferum]MDW5535681.1 response regulator [Azospirillum sp. NL1]
MSGTKALPPSPAKADLKGLFEKRGGVIAFALLAVFALLINQGQQLIAARQAALDSAEASLSSLVAALEVSTTRTVQSVDVTLSSIIDALLDANWTGADASSDPDLMAMLTDRLRRSPHLRGLTLLDRTGRVIATTEGAHPAGTYLTELDVFRLQAAGQGSGLLIGDPRPGRSLIDRTAGGERSGRWLLPMSRALREADGTLQAVVVATVNPDYFQGLYQAVQGGTGAGIGDRIALYRYDGTLLTVQPQTAGEIAKSFAATPLFRHYLPQAEYGVFRQSGTDVGAGPEMRMVAYRTTPVWPLVLTVSVRGDTVLAAWHENLRTASLLSGGMILLLGLFGLLLARSLAAQREQGKELEEANARLSAIVDTAAEGIVTARPDGVIEAANPAAHAIFRCAPGELVGRSVVDLLPTDKRANAIRALEEIARGRRAMDPTARGETIALRPAPDGDRNGEQTESFPLAYSMALVKTAAGPLYAAILRDLTEEKRLEHTLRDAKERAEDGQRIKMEFLATMSHEIRTPMNGVIGMAGLLLDTPMKTDQRAYAETIRDSAESLLVIINDILDFSKIDAGRLDLEIGEFELVPMVESVAEILAPRAAAKGLDLASFVPTELRGTLLGDAGRLRQILLNLAGNAVKFTDSGSVTILLSEEPPVAGAPATGNAGDTVCVRFEVRDTGIGIPEEERPRLFAMFTQVDSSPARRHGGTGLGLAICKRLAELMGGRIGVDSQAGAGSVFWVAVPLKRGAGSAHPPAPIGDWAGCRLLLVDDIAVNRDLLTRQIDGFGIIVETTENGEQALDRLVAAVRLGTPFDAAILDHRMPGLTGPEVAQRIRAIPELAGIRLALASSQRLEGLEPEQAPVDIHLPKPIRFSTLCQCLARLLEPHALPLAGPPAASWLNGTPGSGTPADNVVPLPIRAPAAVTADAKTDPAPGNQPEPTPRARVLVAEDNPVNQQLTLALLRRAGHSAEAVSNGEEAVEAVTARPYDLVLMDVQMPVMDGLTATRRIRRLSGPVARIPVVALTANAMQGDAAICLEAGMDDYLSKPINARKLLDTIGRFVRPATDEGGEATGQVAPPPPKADPEPATVNTEKIEELRDALGKDGFALLLETFFSDSPRHLDLLRAAIARGDRTGIEREAHILKGSAANVGFDRLAATAHYLVAATRRGDIDALTATAGERVAAELSMARKAAATLEAAAG